MVTADEVLRFWLQDVGADGWFRTDADLDGTIRDRFAGTWDTAMAGRLPRWRCDAPGTLAYVVLTDQFPRNMFRGTAKAYASDALARGAAQTALAQGWDRKIDAPARMFFYLPFEHSESPSDQARSVRLMAARLDDPELLLHARAHRAVIRRFGRFPFRNPHLHRTSTPDEQAFLTAGGYRTAVEAAKG